VIVSGETISFDATQYLIEPWNSLELTDMTSCNLNSFSLYLDAELTQLIDASHQVSSTEIAGATEIKSDTSTFIDALSVGSIVTQSFFVERYNLD